MKTYVSSLLISAEPMNRGNYNQYRSWTIPQDQDPTDEGFLIENFKGNANHPNHKGYITWLPYLEFMAQYTEVPYAIGKPSYQQRVLAEHTELVKKLTALKAFFETDFFLKCSQTERLLLQEQCRAMTAYSNMLDSRIDLFK